jgi:hypothetical protein
MAMTDVGIGHNSGGRTRCIFRAHGDRGYTKLRNAFLQDRRISDETRGLVARLLSLPDDWEVTVQSIIASGKAGRDKVYRMIKEAELYGYVKPERERGDAGKLGRQLYLISDDPQALIEKAAQELYEMEASLEPLPENPEVDEVVAEQQVSPLTAKPDTAKPDLAKPDTAEPDLANQPHKRNIRDKINIPSKDLLSNEQARLDEAPDEYPSDFEEFWKIYPRREGKLAALKAWKKLKIGQKRRAWQVAKRDAAMLKARGQYCPLPATWLNQGRFDDDPNARPAEKPAATSDYSLSGNYTGKML